MMPSVIRPSQVTEGMSRSELRLNQVHELVQKLGEGTESDQERRPANGSHRVLDRAAGTQVPRERSQCTAVPRLTASMAGA